jgi:hypothetical protein
MIIHDYLTASGVKKAVDEFLADKPESPIEISGLLGSQCLLVKT